MTIQTTMIVKIFLGYFSIPFPISSTFAFIVIEFGNMILAIPIYRALPYFTFQKVQYLFSELQFKGPLSLEASVATVVVALLDLHNKKVFFSQGTHFLVLMVLGNTAQSSCSFSCPLIFLFFLCRGAEVSGCYFSYN